MSRDIYHLPITPDIPIMRDMENRDDLVAYINRRMEEKKLKPRRLSILAGASGDLIRNFLSGKSRVMKSNYYNKVMEVLAENDRDKSSDPVRGQIDSAISLWSDGGDKKSIHILAVAAYKIMRPEEENVNFSDKPAEALILSCLMKLQAMGKSLNQIEMAFIFWLALQMPESFKDDARELCAQIFDIDNIGDLRKIDKIRFFDFLNNTGNSGNN